MKKTTVGSVGASWFISYTKRKTMILCVIFSRSNFCTNTIGTSKRYQNKYDEIFL